MSIHHEFITQIHHNNPCLSVAQVDKWNHHVRVKAAKCVAQNTLIEFARPLAMKMKMEMKMNGGGGIEMCG